VIVVRCLVVLAVFIATSAFAAGPKVHIVVGPQAEPIEKFAADEMAGQLQKLFDAEVTIGESAAGENVIYLGTRQSCPIAEKLGDAWPKQNENGQDLRTVDVDGKPALLVAGGSPKAVLWATYELGKAYGIRYFRFGDLYPTSPPQFTLAGFDVGWAGECEWDGLQASPFGLDALGIDEARALVRQLAKLDRTSIRWNVYDLETGAIFGGARFRVDGDTAGRAAFKGAKLFDNPDFAATTTDAALHEAALRYVRELAEEAKKVGIELRLERNADRSAVFTVLPTSAEFREIAGGGCAGVQPEQTVEAYEAILAPVCGEGVAERVVKAFDYCDQATRDGFALPEASMLLQYYDSTEAPPAWWGEVRTHYLNAMNEMYRANTRAREGGRQFTLYYARRFEFGMEYMNAVEALRKAAIAKAAGDKDAQITELEKALDSIAGACNAMAAVARSQSDRGIIAVMNEYGYRPVMKLLEAADAEN
jgi:hypothetical protein